MPKPTNKNDQVILQLRQKIEEKKAELKKAKKFSPTTNCNLVFEEQRYNLHTLDIVSTTLLLVELNTYRMSAEELDILPSTVMLGSYSLVDWINDLKDRRAHLNIKQEEDKLKKMETRLQDLLSADTRIEMELENIANELN